MTSATTAAQQKKTMHSMLASKLHNLTIPQSSSTDHEFDFADVFGPNSSQSSSNHNPNPNPNLFIGDPQIIHNRSHSFIGPSPRYTLSKSLPFQHDFDPDSSGEEDDLAEKVVELEIEKKGKLDCGKIGPGDFEIMRVIGKGSFGKVFQVRRKDRSVINGNGDGEGGIGDGIFAMKVMRKDTIIKNNHVDYMKAERDILTKVIHPFVVQLRYSFQVLACCNLNYCSC